MCKLININTLETICERNTMQGCVNYLVENELGRKCHMVSNNEGEIKKIKHKVYKKARIMKCKTECKICKLKDKEKLTFHHLDKKTKKFELGDSRNLNYSMIEIREEIEKCVVVCERCHVMIEKALGNSDNSSIIFDLLT